MTKRTLHIAASAIALIHLAGVGITAAYVANSADGQAPMVWALWLFVDLPWSLLFFMWDTSFLVTFGLLGTLWWYGVAFALGNLVILLRKRHSRPRTHAT